MGKRSRALILIHSVSRTFTFSRSQGHGKELWLDKELPRVVVIRAQVVPDLHRTLELEGN